MAKKLQFDSAISADFKAASADSFVDNIKMLDVSELTPSLDNFYEISGLEILADDIEREGLKHNLVVSKDKCSDKYIIISGHRRYEAVKLLIKEKRLTSTKVPCYVDGVKSKAECKLNLIMLNATQRKYSDAEIIREYEKLTETLKELESEGKGLSGRVRENIAAILKVSPAQIGKIDNIKHNALPEIENAIKNGDLSISTANEIAKLTPEKQKEVISSKPVSKITSKEVKDILQEEKPAVPVFEDDIDSREEDDGKKPTASTAKKSCTLNGEDISLLLKYIPDLYSLCSIEDEEALEKLQRKLEA